MKISFSFRAFLIYFAVLGVLSWFILDKAVEKLHTAFRQSSETVLVDTANLLATFLEHEFSNQLLDTQKISRLFEDGYKRKIDAKIYSLAKDKIDLEIYVTDRKGIVVYDSTGVNQGQDFSNWRDVHRTLQGQYGARSSFRYEDKTQEGDEKIMVVAAPIKIDNDIVGVISVVKPIRPLEQLLATESTHLKHYVLIALAIALALGYFLSHGFTLAIARLVDYANRIAAGQKVAKPRFMDKRFDHLATAIKNMRTQLEGKEYVERYIHGLTHELKTPLTAVKASAELLSENLPPAEQARFIENIQVSNQRMQHLVDRMLALAQLESKDELSVIEAFDLQSVIEQLMTERMNSIEAFDFKIALNIAVPCWVSGDRLLLRQAIANLFDNALENCPKNGTIAISYQCDDKQHHICIENDGEPLDDYVIERAFERFFSMQSKNRFRKSTGLGLSFVKEIMELHSGSAYLKNSEAGICAGIIWPV